MTPIDPANAEQSSRPTILLKDGSRMSISMANAIWSAMLDLWDENFELFDQMVQLNQNETIDAKSLAALVATSSLFVDDTTGQLRPEAKTLLRAATLQYDGTPESIETPYDFSKPSERVIWDEHQARVTTNWRTLPDRLTAHDAGEPPHR